MLPDGIPIYIPAQNQTKLKQVGIVRGNLYYTPRRYYQFFRKFNGWGLGAHVLKQLLDRHIEYVIFRFYQHDTITDFSMPLDEFIANGEKWEDDSDRSVVKEQQLICNVARMHVTPIK